MIITETDSNGEIMERREYERIPVAAEGIFIFENRKNSNREFAGIIKDICEGGFKIFVDNKNYAEIFTENTRGEKVHFNIVDEYKLFGENISALLAGEATVVRQDTIEDSIVLGCKCTELYKALEKYVSEMKMTRYLNRIQRNNHDVF